MNTIRSIWRPNTERCIVLLDNDFFGQPKEQWQARIDELREDASRSTSTKRQREARQRRGRPGPRPPCGTTTAGSPSAGSTPPGTTWGRRKSSSRAWTRLEAAGIPPRHLMVYMLVGYAPGETMEQVLHRHRRLEERGCHAFPMVYGDNKELKDFQRWVVRPLQRVHPLAGL